MKTLKQLAYIGAILAAAIAPSRAAVINVPNFSFESPTVADGNVGTPSSWTFNGTGGSYNSQDVNFPFTTTGSFGNPLGLLPGTGDGVNYAYINGGGFMSQTLTDVYLADSTYTFTLALGNNMGVFDPNDVSFGLYSGGNLLGTLATVDTNNISLIPFGSFGDFTFTYTTPSSGGPVGTPIQLGVLSGGVQGAVDNVRLSYTAVPEPSTYAMLLLSGVGLILLSHRRRTA